MELLKIEVSKTYNVGNYESVKLGGEWSLNADESLQDAVKTAIAELDSAIVDIKRDIQRKAAAKTKTKVEFGTPLCQKICDRIMSDKTVSREMIDTYYTYNNDVKTALDVAFKMR